MSQPGLDPSAERFARTDRFGPRAPGADGEPGAEWRTARFSPREILREDEEWRVADDVYVTGLHQHEKAVARFFDAVWAKALLDPPIELERHVTRPGEREVIAVYGRFWETKPRRFRAAEKSSVRVQLGYLSRDTGREVGSPADGGALEAELRECAWLPGDPQSKTIRLALRVPRRSRVGRELLASFRPS